MEASDGYDVLPREKLTQANIILMYRSLNFNKDKKGFVRFIRFQEIHSTRLS
jgi:hypothetical protein